MVKRGIVFFCEGSPRITAHTHTNTHTSVVSLSCARVRARKHTRTQTHTHTHCQFYQPMCDSCYSRTTSHATVRPVTVSLSRVWVADAGLRCARRRFADIAERDLSIGPRQLIPLKQRRAVITNTPGAPDGRIESKAHDSRLHDCRGPVVPCRGLREIADVRQREARNLSTPRNDNQRPHAARQSEVRRCD